MSSGGATRSLSPRPATPLEMLCIVPVEEAARAASAPRPRASGRSSRASPCPAPTSPSRRSRSSPRCRRPSGNKPHGHPRGPSMVQRSSSPASLRRRHHRKAAAAMDAEVQRARSPARAFVREHRSRRNNKNGLAADQPEHWIRATPPPRARIRRNLASVRAQPRSWGELSPFFVRVASDSR